MDVKFIYDVSQDEDWDDDGGQSEFPQYSFNSVGYQYCKEPPHEVACRE
jgi:hypothetical protein